MGVDLLKKGGRSWDASPTKGTTPLSAAQSRLHAGMTNHEAGAFDLLLPRPRRPAEKKALLDRVEAIRDLPWRHCEPRLRRDDRRPAASIILTAERSTLRNPIAGLSPSMA